MERSVIAPRTLSDREIFHRLGLEPGWLSEIGDKILAAYSQATPNDAANAGGSFAYFEAVRSFRDALIPKGWHTKRSNNLELTENPKKTFCIAVSSGDKYTGNVRVEPSTKNTKGNQTKKIVLSNCKRPSLFPEIDEAVRKNEADVGMTWIFLYHFDFEKAEMRMELSLPTGFDVSESKIQGWDKRLILPPIEFDASAIIPSEPDDATPEFEFEIRRKKDE